MGSDDLFHKKKRGKRELARKAPKKSPHDTVLIVCEGEKTEVNYFKELCRHYRLNTANIIVMPSKKGSAPISVVEFAILEAEVSEGIDRVMCVFDRDSHQSYQRAIDKIKRYKPPLNAKSKPKFDTITSIPCFEIWVLLHFRYTTKPYGRTGKKSPCANVIADIRQYLPKYSKGAEDLFNCTYENLNIAIKNATRLKASNNKANTDDIETDVHQMVEYLINLVS